MSHPHTPKQSLLINIPAFRRFNAIPWPPGGASAYSVYGSGRGTPVLLTSLTLAANHLRIQFKGSEVLALYPVKQCPPCLPFPSYPSPATLPAILHLRFTSTVKCATLMLHGPPFTVNPFKTPYLIFVSNIVFFFQRDSKLHNLLAPQNETHLPCAACLPSQCICLCVPFLC